jgi:hypothetical protein
MAIGGKEAENLGSEGLEGPREFTIMDVSDRGTLRERRTDHRWCVGRVGEEKSAQMKNQKPQREYMPFCYYAALTKMFANASHELREIIRPFNADHVLTRLLSRLTSCLQEKAKKEGWTVEEDKVDPEGLVASRWIRCFIDTLVSNPPRLADQHPTLKTLTFTHGSKQKKVVDLRQPLPRLGYTGTTTVARLNQAISTHISRQADVSPCDPMKSVSETERGTGLTEEQFKHARRLQDAAHIMSGK